MINAAEIIDSLVGLLRDIPELVALMGGEQGRIFAYHDLYPKRISIDRARYEMPAPGIMVAYQGTSPGSFGRSEVWKHELSITLRAGEEQDGEAPIGYYQLFRLITKGVPASLGLALGLATVHASCQPMDTPALRRQIDAAGVDYFEIAMSFTEIGDD